ncbi:MAG: RNA-binding protein, partial [Steroidobacteraceae bacterium]
MTGFTVGRFGGKPCVRWSPRDSVLFALAGDRSINWKVIEMTKIYVGNLPFSADEEAVRALFSQHGTVESVSLPTDRETGRPRGFGFVEMSRADATKAIESLNGYSMGGRPLRVNEAQDKPRGGGGGGGGFR